MLSTGKQKLKLQEVKWMPFFRGEAVNGINPINFTNISNSWLTYFKGKVFFGYPDANETYPNKVLVIDVEKEKFSIYDYGLNIKSVYMQTTIQHNFLLEMLMVMCGS